MRRNFFILTLVFVASLFFCAQVWAVCPEEPFDGGECDTLHVDIHPPDQDPAGDPPYFVRFPIRVTNDVVDPTIDSIAGFVIPLCYTHSNSAAYCSLSSYWNTCFLCGWKGQFERDIFRHLDGETNWMMWLWEHSSVYPWDYAFLDLDGTSHFWLALAPTGSQDPRFWGGSRVLLATMTFKLEDTTTICIDSCFWPPSDHLMFANSAAQAYVPRHYMPVCQTVGGFPPTRIDCPGPESHSAEGTYESGVFQAYTDDGYVTEVQVWGDLPAGVSNPQVIYTLPPGSTYAEGYVEYTVSDHCQSGGDILLAVFNSVADGPVGECSIPVELTNNPPAVDAPETLFAIAGAVRAFRVYGEDPDGDAVPQVQLDALWYQPDSLMPPVYPPSYEEGNPGFFAWAPTEPEMGTWISSFSATDACGSEGSGQVTIIVGPLFCGNVVDDEILELSDVIYLANYLYRGGPAPDPLCKTDVNCDGVADLGDYVYLINYLYKYGPAPCFDCCAGGL